MIVFAAIVPHPPYSVPGVGTAEEKRKIKKTIGSFDVLRDGLEKAKPDTVIIISPHGTMDRYNFVINSGQILHGSMAAFGADRIFEYKNDIEIVNQIVYAARVNDIFIHLHSYFLDHGALVPLMHLLKNIRPEVVHMSFSMLTYEKHYQYGELISNIFRKSGKRITIIASGDLSHNLIPGAPAGYNPRAKFFDQRIIEYLATKDVAALLSIRKDAVKELRECGMRSFIIMLGMIHDSNYEFELISYEGPYGIGYLCARFI